MDIVWFAEIKWDYLKTRKQQIIGRKPSDVRLLYLEPYVRGRANRYDLRREGDIFCATVPFIKSVPGGLPRRLMDRQLVRRAVDWNAGVRAGRLIDQAGFDRSRLGKVISNIYAVNVAGRVPGRFLLYDCNDAHTAFPGMPDWSGAYHHRTCRTADGVFVSARALGRGVAEIRGGDTGVDLLGNGVDFERFQIEGGLESRSRSVPRFIYIGALAPWVDFDSMRLLAERHPEWELDLVGPVLQGAQSEVDRLESLVNVTRHEPVAYERVPHLLAGADIALIPFRYNDLTRGVNPNKMYEYLAAGLPVVTTDFSEEIRVFPELVQNGDPGEGFVAACEAMAAEWAADTDGRMAAEARQIASNNDWNSIADTFWARVKKMMTAV